MRRRDIPTVITVCLLASITVYEVTEFRAKQRINIALQSGLHATSEIIIPPDYEGTWKDPEVRARRIRSMAAAKSNKNVESIGPFLNDESRFVREVAADALSEIATEEAAKRLSLYIASNPLDYKAKWYRASISARDLKGARRLDILCQSVGLKFSDVPQLSKRLLKNRPYSYGSVGDFVVTKVVNEIHEMGVEGQDVHSLAKGLILEPNQQVIVDTASLSGPSKVEYLLDQISMPPKGVGSNKTAISMLAEMGPAVK